MGHQTQLQNVRPTLCSDGEQISFVKDFPEEHPYWISTSKLFGRSMMSKSVIMSMSEGFFVYKDYSWGVADI